MNRESTCDAQSNLIGLLQYCSTPLAVQGIENQVINT